MSDTRILVVGAGSTGGYYGGRLMQAGRDVTFLVRPGRRDLLRERGLRVVGNIASFTVTPSLITADELTGSYDLVLLGVKATGLAAAVDDLAPAVGPDTTILPFLNGMGHMDLLNERFGADRVLGGVAKVATEVDDAGDIRLLGTLSTLDIGEQDGGSTERLRRVVDTLAVPGIDLSVSPAITAAMWHKWVYIVTTSSVTTLMGGTVADVVSVPGGALLGPAIAREAASISAAAGYPMPDAMLEALSATVSTGGAPLTTSLFRDLVAGRATETEPMLGAMVRRAEQLSLHTPLIGLALMRMRVYETRRTA